MNAIDTNVVAYLFDPDATEKHSRTQQLLDELVVRHSRSAGWDGSPEPSGRVRRPVPPSTPIVANH
jgi:hypothetical protein